MAHPIIAQVTTAASVVGANEEDRPRLSTQQKALKINLDPDLYGTFAEIGAGQEVARWFFHVGAAAGTISKSISAYDMAVSDAIYGGRCKRYVSRERLQSMLDHEHGLNLERLRSSGGSTAFFAFADTVAARNFQGTNECHGWMGVKFQAHPRDDDSQITMHVLDAGRSKRSAPRGAGHRRSKFAPSFFSTTSRSSCSNRFSTISVRGASRST
jgi:hypothetical protein